MVVLKRISTAYQCCICRVNSYLPYLHIAQHAMLLMIPLVCRKARAIFTKVTSEWSWHQITQTGVAFILSPTWFSHANARSLWQLKYVRSKKGRKWCILGNHNAPKDQVFFFCCLRPLPLYKHLNPEKPARVGSNFLWIQKAPSRQYVFIGWVVLLMTGKLIFTWNTSGVPL